MKKTLIVLAAAGSLGIGLAAPASASPYVPVKPFHHKHWGGGFGGYYPGYPGIDPGFSRPAFYPGMYWGGHRIFYRPTYAGAFADCTWGRVMTPWGPRWRPLCY